MRKISFSSYRLVTIATLIFICISSVLFISLQQGTKMATNEGWILPQEDVSGSDFLDVPRYPGAVRVYWSDGYSRDNAWISPPRPFNIYAVNADIRDVINFYTMEMNAHGWVLTRSENNAITSFTFEKELENVSPPAAKAICTITLEKNYQWQSNIVGIHVAYHETWWI
jgi:hypothetical protein